MTTKAATRPAAPRTKDVQLSMFGLLTTTSLGTTTPPEAPVAGHASTKVRTHAPAEPARNYALDGVRSLARDWKGRARDNIEAIRIANDIAATGRQPTDAERDKLMLFTGFGAGPLANNLFRAQDQELGEDWRSIGTSLERLTAPGELASLARTTQYAHYTPEHTARAIWKAVQGFGFQGGRVLEPGAGSGMFIATMPKALMRRTAVTAVEMDPTTARILKANFPEAWVRTDDFTKIKIGEEYDLAIGNPPFSSRTVDAPDPAGRHGFSLHDYFIARAVERLLPGGIAAFVTSRYTMDKANPAARDFIAQMANLVAAIRLPAGSMSDMAGTEVIVDILFLQKRGDGDAVTGAAWRDLATVLPGEGGADDIQINEYFVGNQAMMVGEARRVSSQWGPAFGCVTPDGVDFESALDAVVSTLPRNIFRSAGTNVGLHGPSATPRPELRVEVGTASTGATVKEGSYIIHDEVLHQIVNSMPVKVAIKSGRGTEGIFPKHARIITMLIPIRTHLREVLKAQETNQSWQTAQKRLNDAYERFRKAFGPINHTVTIERENTNGGAPLETQRMPNLSPFMDDPDCWLVSSIEEYDADTDHAEKGRVFTDRVILPPAAATISTAADALAVSLQERGTVDLQYAATLYGQSFEETVAELDTAVFKNPETGTWQTDDDYLAGAVRTKLEIAIEAAKKDRGYERNVAALREVQPVDLKPSEITARLGSPWLDPKVIEAFTAEVLEIPTRIQHNEKLAIWGVTSGYDAKTGANAVSQWGTDRRNAVLLLEEALNSISPKVYDTVYDASGKKTQVLNATETEAAREKQNKIKSAFEGWVWTDPDRTETLARLYNDTYNNLVPRKFNGKHLVLPGASNVINFYPHQKRAIWRIISAGSTYLAHRVGSGKTFTLAAAIMEQRRLGLIRKAILTVPGHCLAQASREFLQLYPNAKILVADEANFEASKRQRFIARATTGDWDAIIITHSAFKLIPSPADFERGMINDMLASYEAMIAADDGEDRITRKRLERLKEGLEAKLEGLAGRKDDMVTIREMGVDQIVVDEAHEFRKLSFATNMSGLKGIDPDGSQRSWDLMVKTRLIETINERRALILSSGTPISNTLGELFSVCRLVAPELLAERSVHEFDAWASVFGSSVTELELQPSGKYKPVTRFAEFVNVPEMISMFRTFADVVLREDLLPYLKLPRLKTGRRILVTAPASEEFKYQQALLAERIQLIETRKGMPKPGDDILLKVITDGRHLAIDTRFMDGQAANDPNNKVNALIGNVLRIYQDNAENVYTDPATGRPYAIRGVAQMIFSDLGTEAALEKRGFSAYLWIRDELIRQGIPANEIAFAQHCKKSSDKQRLFNNVNSGHVKVVLGSTAKMGTGANAQQRLKALHQLDVPWLPSDVEQREGRIERQGNQNEEIEVYVYATLGSVDSTQWQGLERKKKFIEAALAGDKTIRRLEDANSDVNQFAMAKALASGDPRLMQKAGLDAEIDRLYRLRNAHFDDQHNVRRQIADLTSQVAYAEKRVIEITEDLRQRTPTRGNLFAMTIGDDTYTERAAAGAEIIGRIKRLSRKQSSETVTIGSIGGFAISVHGEYFHWDKTTKQTLNVERNGHATEINTSGDVDPVGLIRRMENSLLEIDNELDNYRHRVVRDRQRLESYRARLGQTFEHQAELDEKEDELAALERDMAETKGARERPATAEMDLKGGGEPMGEEEDDGDAGDSTFPDIEDEPVDQRPVAMVLPS